MRRSISGTRRAAAFPPVQFDDEVPVKEVVVPLDMPMKKLLVANLVVDGMLKMLSVLRRHQRNTRTS